MRHNFQHRFWIVIFSGIVLLSLQSFAQSRDFKTWGLNLVARQYTYDSQGSSPVELTPMQELEMSLRLYKLYHFSLIHMRSTDGQRIGYGAGIRVNLPGYFLLGAQLPQLTRDSKMYPVNTSIYGFAIRTDLRGSDPAVNQTTMLAQYGGSVDLFLFNRYTFLTLDLGIHTLLGDSTWIYGVGFGLQF
jgi:hypothetical protein